MVRSYRLPAYKEGEIRRGTNETTRRFRVVNVVRRIGTEEERKKRFLMWFFRSFFFFCCPVMKSQRVYGCSGSG